MNGVDEQMSFQVQVPLEFSLSIVELLLCAQPQPTTSSCSIAGTWMTRLAVVTEYWRRANELARVFAIHTK
jgi:hypothetical protein